MYQVEWLARPLDALADAYVMADPATRALMVSIVERWNRVLASAPYAVGESRGGRWRVDLDKPCAIAFTVDPARRLVQVKRFWKY